MSFWGAPWASHHRRGLRGYVYFLLSRGPKTGAELIDEMDRMSMGWWRPSPGSVYPLLDELNREGVVKKRDDGRYELTSPPREGAGWPFSRAGPRSATEAAQEIDGLLSYLEDLQTGKADEFAQAKEKLRAAAGRLDRLVK